MKRTETQFHASAQAFLLTAIGLAASAGAAPGLPPSDVALRVQGPDLVNDAGEPVTLRAINLGNWFLLEMWMLGGQPLPDMASFVGTLESRFGEAEADRLMGLYWDGWITQRDMDTVAMAGFNTVRLPFSHTVLESEPFVLDEAGFERLLNAIELADNAGLYVILDMHQVPGGQSFDQPSGDVTANDLWTDPQAQERLAWLWQHIARRVKNTRNVVAYDLINEPYSAFNDDVRPQLLAIVDKTIKAIREVDPDRLIFAPGAIQGIEFYGDPADRGWANTGFTQHFYPGIFDWRPNTMGAHARFLATEIRERAEYAKAIGVPFFWGEFNPVFDSAGSFGTVRDTFDLCASLGMHAAVWSHKIVSQGGGVGPSNWYLVTNEQPLGLPNIQTASLSTIETVFESLATMPLAIDGPYLEALTEPAYPRTLPVVPEPPFVAPASDAWTTWSAVDIGSPRYAGGQAVAPGATATGADSLTVYSSGLDLWNNADSIRLVSRPMPANFAVSGVLDAFEGGRYAQAGVTVRANDSASAPHLSLLCFPDGRLVVKSRPSGGASTSERFIGYTGFPVGLAVGRAGGSFLAWHTDADGAWQPITVSESPSVGTPPIAGFFGAANRFGPLSAFRFDEPGVIPPVAPTDALDLDTGTNMLLNPSFEQSAGGTANPAHWSTFGDQFQRVVGWQPVRDGSALLAFRHWEAPGDFVQGASQDVAGFTPGERYVLTVYVNRDDVDPGQSLADAVKLRVEETGSPIRHNEQLEFDAEDIESGDGWSRLQVRFIATQPTHRVALEVDPAASNRDGAIKFDGLVLEADPQ